MEPPEPCVHRTDIQLRFGDTDALGHVNNASYARFAEVARLQLLDGVGASVRSIILAHLSIDFVRPVKFGDAVSVETRVGHLGRSSITLQQTVTAGGETAADIRSVLVFFDYQHNRARKLPTPLRKRLSQYQ